MGENMQALRLVTSASDRPEENLVLMPDQLRILGRAFDEVWDAIEAHYVSDPQSVEAARLRLANCLLAKYQTGLTNPEMLKAAALQALRPPGLALSSRPAAVHPRP